MALNKSQHIAHAKRCLGGLGASAVEHDCNRMLVGFYSLSILDLMSRTSSVCGEEDELDSTSAMPNAHIVTEVERNGWREWIWSQYVHTDQGAGFHSTATGASNPHLIITYAALLSLAILRDDFQPFKKTEASTAQTEHGGFDVRALAKFVGRLQKSNGSFIVSPSTDPSEGEEEADVRMTYCAFAICTMLGPQAWEWSGVDVRKAVEYVQSCRAYEGGYGETPGREAHGGSTFCALGALYLAPLEYSSARLTEQEKQETLRWLAHNQVADENGADENEGLVAGFRGRTEKEADACYSFWCCASAKILCEGGAYADVPVDAGSAVSVPKHIINPDANVRWIKSCEFKWGGIGKVPGATGDPYHTYLGIASTALFPPAEEVHGDEAKGDWLPEMDVLMNGRRESVQWLKARMAERNRSSR